MMIDMERAGQLDRHLAALPSEDELDARMATGTGLTNPEFAVLLSQTKIIAKQEINESSLPDDPWTHRVLVEYFPTLLRECYADRMARHRLRREIVTTMVVNEAVNRGGITFTFRAMEETGARLADVLRAYIVARDVYGLDALWSAVESPELAVPAATQTAVCLHARRLVDRAVRWLVTNKRPPLDVTAEIARLRPGVEALMPSLDKLVPETENTGLREPATAAPLDGLPEDLAEWATRITYGFSLLDIVEASHTTGRDVHEVAAVYFLLYKRFRVDDLLMKITELPRGDRWQTLARMALRDDLYAALAALTVGVLKAPYPSGSAEERIAQWERANAANIARAESFISEFGDSRADLAALSVLLRKIRTVVRSSAA
jgi:glutamate dehydrogenase